MGIVRVLDERIVLITMMFSDGWIVNLESRASRIFPLGRLDLGIGGLSGRETRPSNHLHGYSD